MLKRNTLVIDMLVRKMEFLAKNFMMIRSQLERNEDIFGRRILKRQQKIFDSDVHENWEIRNVRNIKKRAYFQKMLKSQRSHT